MPKPAPNARTPSDAEDAAKKRFSILAGSGVLIVVVLGFLVLRPEPEVEDVEEPVPVVLTDSAATAAAAPSTAAPPSGGGRGSGGGRPGGGGGGGGAPSRLSAAVEQVRSSVRDRGLSLGLSPRAAAAIADSAAGRSGGSAPASPGGSAGSAGRATTIMSEPGGGAALVTVPSGTAFSVGSCETAGGSTWCRATYGSVSGWVRQSDVGR